MKENKSRVMSNKTLKTQTQKTIKPWTKLEKTQNRKKTGLRKQHRKIRTDKTEPWKQQATAKRVLITSNKQQKQTQKTHKMQTSKTELKNKHRKQDNKTREQKFTRTGKNE